VVNAKTHRTSVCNAAESCSSHADVADDFLPRVIDALHERGVTVHGDGRFREYEGVSPATDEDHALSISRSTSPPPWWRTSRLPSSTSARYSSGHTDAIVASRPGHDPRFVASVDSAAVLVNASTRFTDGAEFGSARRSASARRSCTRADRWGCSR
jgi:glutamate-5-semialdehyde dehydrogenase